MTSSSRSREAVYLNFTRKNAALKLKAAAELLDFPETIGYFLLLDWSDTSIELYLGDGLELNSNI